MNYWSALDILKQVAGELGLPQPATIVSTDVQGIQLLAFLQSAGNELMTYYPWEQFVKEWEFSTVDGQESYDLPADWRYFVDQTQWDKTNHWPLLGPKSPQEWAWLKGGLLAAAPRMRYRVYQYKFWLWPVPGAGVFDMRMEYIISNWVLKADTTLASLVSADDDRVMYDPWMVIKYIKLKFFELKGFDTAAMQSDFMRVFQALTGKDRGAPKLSLAPRYPTMYIGPWSIPDGSWDTGSMTP